MDEEPRHALELAGRENAEPGFERSLDHAGAEPLDGGQLGFRRMIRRDDGALHAQPAGVPGDALRHVAGAGGPDPLCQLLARHGEHGVTRAAQLEGANRLQILELQVDLTWSILEIQLDQRDAQHRVLRSLARGANLLDRDRLCTCRHETCPFQPTSLGLDFARSRAALRPRSPPQPRSQPAGRRAARPYPPPSARACRPPVHTVAGSIRRSR